MKLEHGDITIWNGDCREVMPELDLVDAIVCDPPYGLQFMGKGWDHGVPGVEFWALVLAVMKPGAHLLAFGGTRTHHRLMCAIEDAGFEIRDCVMWVYGTGFPKSLDVSKAIDKAAGADREVVAPGSRSAVRPVVSGQSGEKSYRLGSDASVTAPATDQAQAWSGWGTALKPAFEVIVLCRKPLGKGMTVAQNVLEYGTGALNIDACRVVSREMMWEEQRNRVFLSAAFAALKTKLEELVQCPSSVGIDVGEAVYERGEMHHADINRPGIGCSDGMLKGDMSTNLNTEDCGRMPTVQSLEDIASIIETASKPTIDWKTWNSCQSPNTSVITKESITAAMRNLKHAESRLEITGAGRWPSNLIHDGSDEVVELFPNTGKSPAPRSERTPIADQGNYGNSRKSGLGGHNDSGSAARFFYAAKASKAERGPNNDHPTIKPIALMQYLIRLVTPPGGTVLDPFMGSGSTLLAARQEGFASVGIEMNQHYFRLAAQRIWKKSEE